MSTQRYPTKQYRRTALLPGLLGAVACLAGLAAVGGGIFTLIQYLVSILAAIVIVFAFQARHWWWLPLFAAVVVAFNPVFPFTFANLVWTYLLYGATVLFIAAAVLVRVVNTEDRNRR
jgi:hypothetical protein